MRHQYQKELLQFLLITFGIMYGIGFVGMLFRPAVEQLFGPINNKNPLVIFLIYSPSLSAIIMTTAKESPACLLDLLKGALKRAKPAYWITAVLFIPVLLLIRGIAQFLVPGAASSFNLDNYLKTFPLILFSLTIFRDAGPLGEELGWRGYALPRLLKLYSPFKATLILSFVWTAFHFVSFLAPGTAQSSMNLIWFTLSITSSSFIMTWLYIKSGGNWLLSGVIPHYLINIFISREAAAFGPGLCIISAAAAVLFWTGPSLLWISRWGRKIKILTVKNSAINLILFLLLEYFLIWHSDTFFQPAYKGSNFTNIIIFIWIILNGSIGLWKLRKRKSSAETAAIISEFRLSPREAEVFIKVSKGLGNKDIAYELDISENTVKRHMNALFKKCGVDSRFKLAALSNGWNQENAT